VVIAALLGAEEYGFSTAPLIVLGCIMMRKCHLNTCPVGIATQDPALRKKFAGDPEHVVNYLFMVAEEARQHMASMGFRTVNEMIGRADALETDSAFQHWKADGLDLSAVLSPARKPHPDVEVYCTIAQDHGLDQVLDQQLVAQCQAALNHGSRIRLDLPIKNTDRCVGGILSHTITKQWGEAGLPDDTIHLKFTGSAGQSLGAWLAQGVNIELEGDANDYVGKGLSGGRIIVYPSPAATFVPEDNIIVGNVCLYGAITGEVFIRGIAAERFAVRNSGAIAVVEGVGDHGCEYMTGGRVVILGSTGRNFAAGMSGGITYVWDPEDQLRGRCNLEMVELEALLDDPDIHELRTLIERHKQFTGSAVAARLLADWPQTLRQFIKVMPTDYKRVLMQQQRVAAQAA
jgi:glutamate synthase domain-containing protein 3